MLNAEGVRAKSAQGGAKSAVRACQGPGRQVQAGAIASRRRCHCPGSVGGGGESAVLSTQRTCDGRRTAHGSAASMGVPSR